ncbi:HesA/MoeB/ThiF family protein [Gaoshiqia sediminis]|uniref:HesA/MoeB/ThiF family protein n=1 Tax=Gaoshiqia sediminis TaxID=2986998 RepID=A0AA42C846_9BACT|nr:HesA/MoeB/ThiF family protein [Gaoshiqia sediminis]MCW0482311.1 HesA/MoeB/ThiF family protein [Gaoshiqia sediminis]
MERFERQIILPELGREGQQKLKMAKVLVAGAGGLGCPAILYLAAAGVGTIGIADGDQVEASNLNRQVLFGFNNIGSSKAAAAAKFISERYPDTQVNVYDRFLTVENIPKILPFYDIVIDGTDSFATRYMLNDASVLFGKPLVYGAIYRYEGQIALFNTGKGSANYRDLFPKIPDSGEIANCSEAGVLGVLPGIFGTLQATEAIKWITGIGELLINKVLFCNLKNHSFYEIDLVPSNEAQKNRPATLEVFLKTDYSVNCQTVSDIGWNEALESSNPKSSVFIDIREPDEIPRWSNSQCLEIPYGELEEKAELFSEETSIFLFCQHGIRSRPAAVELRKTLKRNNIYSVTGGVEHPDSPVKQLI